MADLTLTTITKGMEDGAETINANFDATKTKINNDLGDTGWKNLTLASGCTTTSNHTAQIRKIGNHVYLRGAVSLAAKGTAVSALPYKPTVEVGFNCGQMSTTAGQNANVYAEPTGELNVIFASNFDKGIWLDQVEYFTD